MAQSFNCQLQQSDCNSKFLNADNNFEYQLHILITFDGVGVPYMAQSFNSQLQHSDCNSKFLNADNNFEYQLHILITFDGVGVPYKHLIKFADFVDGKFEYRFASHPRFSYWALNMIQRKRALQQTGIYLKQNPGDAPMSSADIHNLMDTCNAQSNMYKLSRYVGNILGSNAYWQKQKQDLRTIVSKKGTGTIFFTFSAADMHWEELHALFHKNPAQLSSQERRQNVINNPHLTDWFFVQRLENFIQNWLYKTLNAEWHWYRYEYQARGSVHCHGIAKLKNDPGICHLAENALKGFKAQKQTLQQNNPQDSAQIIEDGISSSAIICSYADWLFSTVNPNPPENGNWVKPTIHPCQHSYKETNSDEDLVNLLNTVQRHTHCSTRYCLQKNAEEDQIQCRFRFPKPLCKETCLQFEKNKCSRSDRR